MFLPLDTTPYDTRAGSYLLGFIGGKITKFCNKVANVLRRLTIGEGAAYDYSSYAKLTLVGYAR